MKKRKLEKSVHTNLSRDDDYTGYLQLDKLLDAQLPLSNPVHHDEMLFIIQHQVAELWIKLLIHEVGGAIAHLRNDELRQAVKNLARVRHIQSQLYNQWKVLDTLTPSEYEEFLMYLARRGMPVPKHVINRDFGENRDEDDEVVAVLRTIYENRSTHWSRYEACEALMDIANNFQFWRFHHMKTVERIIGHKAGSGGSSGVMFLKKALDIEFFPELLRVRTEIGSSD
ncbi:MAG: tryptophan 2,3-dioxygenase [Proteobacteria bacterium]|nr:tryptophan 2,3-dioxygenase [Pseudomonadota bacterium]